VPQALQAYRQAVHWEPELAGAYLGLARCYWQLGHVRAAAQAVEQVLVLDPGNAAALALRRQIEIP
jgi:thioredoxin-like negative regulator of GroEL